MGKPNALSSHSQKQKSYINLRYFEDGQLMVLGEDNVLDRDDVEVEGVDVVGCEMKDNLLVVPTEFKLTLLKQHINK